MQVFHPNSIKKEQIMKNAMKCVPIENVDVTGGFWYEKQKLVREVSMQNVYKRFFETGRFDAFGFTWKEGEPNKPHVYWDSDVAKWIEAVGYIAEKHSVPKLEAIADSVIDNIEKNRMADGYFNSYFGHLEPEARFTRRNDHELYCLGHLIEAAIAYKRGTGKDKLLSLMLDYVDLVYKVFYVEKSAVFLTPGHEEIELALIKLYLETKDRRHLDLAKYFVDARGTDPERDHIEGERPETFQTHIPARRQKDAVGHAVRAGYLYSAVADIARLTNDEELYEVAKSLFESITKRRMYVTGAIGQNPCGEAFCGDYDLPNQTAYAETCANLSLALFARRMSLIEPMAHYADTAERVLYNSFISGMSLDGKAFFYSNMQENDLRVRQRPFNKKHTIFCPADVRVEVFKTSCCPPNVVRTVSSIQDFAYATDGERLFIHQYMSSDVRHDGCNIKVETNYPFEGDVRISAGGASKRLAVRIPGWCKKYSIKSGAISKAHELKNGYAYLEIADGESITLNLDMPIRLLEAHPMIWEDAGKVAVTRGPLVYCIEGVDNPYPLSDIRIDKGAEYKTVFDGELGYPTLVTTAYVRDWGDRELYSDEAELKAVAIKLIPYFAFANRGETDLVIWALKA